MNKPIHGKPWNGKKSFTGLSGYKKELSDSDLTNANKK
jgi:hypothetical protein